MDHSLSRRRQSQQPLATSSRTSAKGTRSSTRIPQRPAATHLKDLSFFLKMLEAKVRYDPEITDDFPIRMRQIEQLFLDLNYALTGRQLNDLFLNQFEAGEKFRTQKLISWVRLNYPEMQQ